MPRWGPREAQVWPSLCSELWEPYSGTISTCEGGDLAGAHEPVCVQIVKELLSHGADPNLLLTRGLGNALCVACDLTYEHQRSMDSKLALVRSEGRGVTV